MTKITNEAPVNRSGNRPFHVQINYVPIIVGEEQAYRVLVTVVTQDLRSYSACCDTGCGSDERGAATEMARYYAYEKLFNDRG